MSANASFLVILLYAIAMFYCAKNKGIKSKYTSIVDELMHNMSMKGTRLLFALGKRKSMKKL